MTTMVVKLMSTINSHYSRVGRNKNVPKTGQACPKKRAVYGIMVANKMVLNFLRLHIQGAIMLLQTAKPRRAAVPAPAAAFKIPKDLSGCQGLLLAVIATAARDALSTNKATRRDALKYFRGDTYKRHLQLLDLPSDALPVGIRLD